MHEIWYVIVHPRIICEYAPPPPPPPPTHTHRYWHCRLLPLTNRKKIWENWENKRLNYWYAGWQICSIIMAYGILFSSFNESLCPPPPPPPPPAWGISFEGSGGAENEGGKEKTARGDKSRLRLHLQTQDEEKGNTDLMQMPDAHSRSWLSVAEVDCLWHKLIIVVQKINVFFTSYELAKCMPL